MKENCAVILAAGEGTRMKSEKPKAMAEVLFKPMLRWVLDAVIEAGVKDICVVAGYKSEIIEEYLHGECTLVRQTERLGTGHAVKCAADFIAAHSGANVLVLNGDAPFMDAVTISDALKAHTAKKSGVTVISANVSEPFGYGRIVRSADGEFKKITEEKEASAEEKLITEINSGAMWFNSDALSRALSLLRNDNAKGEYYLTDTIEIIRAEGSAADAFAASEPDVVLGANTRVQLAELNSIARSAQLEKQMLSGVDIPCADGVIICPDAVIGTDTTVLPGTIIKSGVKIGKGCTIGPDTLLENSVVGDFSVLNSVQCHASRIGSGVTVGPFVYIRPGCVIADKVHIGDFVEIKNSTVGEGTKLPHLTYIGDSDIGSGVNFGCGSVTVNYTGKEKFRTTVRDGAFIGCNTNLVAPVTVGEKAYTAAGSTITHDVPDNALAIARSAQVDKEEWVTRKKPYKNK